MGANPTLLLLIGRFFREHGLLLLLSQFVGFGLLLRRLLVDGFRGFIAHNRSAFRLRANLTGGMIGSSADGGTMADPVRYVNNIDGTLTLRSGNTFGVQLAPRVGRIANFAIRDA
jgi:hypothetical protein